MKEGKEIVVYQGIEFEIRGNYLPYRAGKHTGDPDDCYPAEGGYWENYTIHIGDSPDLEPVLDCEVSDVICQEASIAIEEGGMVTPERLGKMSDHVRKKENPIMPEVGCVKNTLFTWFTCPTCGNTYALWGDKMCSECGQKFKWEGPLPHPPGICTFDE